MSRNASASHRPRPWIACSRHGPRSPAASARIQPVLRGSLPSNPSKKFHADAATRSWRNNGRIRAFTSRNEDAQSPSVVSIDAPTIHDPPNHAGLWIQNPKQNATVMLRTRKALLTQVFFEGRFRKTNSNCSDRPYDGSSGDSGRTCISKFLSDEDFGFGRPRVFIYTLNFCCTW